jgi:hypothetical protein
MRHVRLRLLVCALLALALVPAAAGASAGGGWTTHRSASGRFTVSTPSTWIDMTRLTPQVLAKAKTVPALQQYITLLRTSKVVKLLVADAGATSIANRYASNLNIVQAPTVGDLRFQRDATVAGLRSTGVVKGAVHSKYVTLPAGKAVSLQYEARFNTTTPTVSLQQYLLLRGGKVTVLTYTTLPKLRGTYAAVFARSVRSFRFR